MSGKEPSRYLNRELSWLEFNQRVLNEALDAGVPLLERVKFLAITASNLDEFFMVRAGGLQLLLEQGVRKTDPSGMTPGQQLRAISQRTHEMVREQYACYTRGLAPALAAVGITHVTPNTMNEQQAHYAEDFFRNEVLPVITPMAVRAPAEFPLLVNLGLNMLIRLNPEDEPRYAVIPLGTGTGRFVSLRADEGYAYVLIEDIIRMSVGAMFPGEQVLEAVLFRITRNADQSVREDMAGDLLEGMQEVLSERKKSDCVRLEVENGATKPALAFLKEALDLQDRDVYRIPGPLKLSDLMAVATMQGFDELRYEPWPPQPLPDIDLKESIFQTIAQGDILLSHPYESFDPVLRLVEEAADDPDVLSIKQILYRTSRHSPIIAALQRAAERGKYVTALVELKARFDEARNIGWAKRLEEAGVQVIYGVKGLKTHAKLLIVVRREATGIVRYLHFGTGNYNETTARLYSDVSLLTCDEHLGADASAFFNAISGYSQIQQYLKLEAAPTGLRDKLLEMIQSETERRRQGQKALIMAKMNSLVDPALIDALYQASQAGVQVLLNVRGICCLRPGVANLSENITVVSIVDRFLEHSRLFYFRHGGEETVYISSADWMQRNLDRRVELLTPVEDKSCRKKLIRTLKTYFDDREKSSELMADGHYERLMPSGRRKPQRAQEVLYRRACAAVEEAEQRKRTAFEPHRPSDSEEA